MYRCAPKATVPNQPCARATTLRQPSVLHNPCDLMGVAPVRMPSMDMSISPRFGTPNHGAPMTPYPPTSLNGTAVLGSGRFCRVALSLAAFVMLAKPTKLQADNLWSHSNLTAWCVVPFDSKARPPEARARMLAGLGFGQFAYDWRAADVPSFDTEIDALTRNGIRLVAWWFPFDADDPLAKAILETFRRHGVSPQLWVYQSQRPVIKAAKDQSRHVELESDRIGALVRLAEPYGCRVELYNHNGWYGRVENQLAIIDNLKANGITNVGMVYNFSHARDADHDDSKDFQRLWSLIKDHVVAVNISGMSWEGRLVYPSEGDKELEMMRVIEASGWRGPVGLIAEKGGDAEVTLRNYLRGLDLLAAQLRHQGSDGDHPLRSSN